MSKARRRLPMLEVIDLTVAYGPVVALHAVSLTVPDGSMTAVLGANGAGKTTLVRTISGLTRPRGGSVRLDGHDITRLAPEEIARLGVAHVPQGQGVLAELTVDENLRLGGLWRRDPKGQRGADRKSTRLNSSHSQISYAVFCLKKKTLS